MFQTDDKPFIDIRPQLGKRPRLRETFATQAAKIVDHDTKQSVAAILYAQNRLINHPDKAILPLKKKDQIIGQWAFSVNRLLASPDPAGNKAARILLHDMACADDADFICNHSQIRYNGGYALKKLSEKIMTKNL